MIENLENRDASVRLRAVTAIGTNPDPRFVDTLVERCAVEPDFQVREALTWSLTRRPSSSTVPGLVDELRSERAQARSQALHTLSKIGDRRAWPAITRELDRLPTPSRRHVGGCPRRSGTSPAHHLPRRPGPGRGPGRRADREIHPR